jgi:hypothetical protein
MATETEGQDGQEATGSSGVGPTDGDASETLFSDGAGDPANADGSAPAARVKAKAPPLDRAQVLAQLEALKSDGVVVLDAKGILGANDLTYRIVPVPEWGGSLVLRSGTGTERDAFESSLVIQQGKKRITNTQNVRAKLARLAIVDPSDPELRRPLFNDTQLKQLGAKSALALARVYDVAAELWGITDDDVEELAGNSEGAGSGASSGT